MDARTFQEAIRSATVTYPIPFIFSILLLVTVLSAGGHAVLEVAGPLRLKSSDRGLDKQEDTRGGNNA